MNIRQSLSDILKEIVMDETENSLSIFLETLHMVLSSCRFDVEDEIDFSKLHNEINKQFIVPIGSIFKAKREDYKKNGLNPDV